MPRCICQCQQEAEEQRKAAEERQRRMERIKRRKAQGLQDRYLYDYTFANDNGQNPLMDKARAYVENWKEAYKSNIGLLLFGDVGTGKSFFAGCIANAFLNRDGLPKTAVNYDAMFKCLAKKYNKCHKEPLPDVMTPHTMRHTFCTRMANAGMNPKALQYIMGHANIVMTLNYYAHATFHSAQEEMERLQAKAKTTAEAKPEPAAESAEETKAA